MRHSSGSDLKFLGLVLARLKPFVRDGVIRRTRLERVLGTFDVPANEVRPEVERLLAKAGITIDEDKSAVASPTPKSKSPRASAQLLAAVGPEVIQQESVASSKDAAIRAARRRMELDKHISNHGKILLCPEEEVGLALLVRGDKGAPLEKGDFGRLTGESRQAGECLFLHNQGLVHFVAQRFAPTGMTYEDLFQHGSIGLLRAIELFDPGLGNKFSTYAVNWVRQAIARGMANESRLIRLPVHMVERVRKVWMTRDRLTFDGEPPSIHQLALACELSESEVLECLTIGPENILSLDMPVQAGSEMTLADLLDVSDPDLSPARLAEDEVLRTQFQAVIDSLDEREARILSLRFGLVDGESKTLDEIGKVYGVTRERIRQIEKKVITKLQQPSYKTILAEYLSWASK